LIVPLPQAQEYQVRVRDKEREERRVLSRTSCRSAAAGARPRLPLAVRFLLAADDGGNPQHGAKSFVHGGVIRECSRHFVIEHDDIRPRGKPLDILAANTAFHGGEVVLRPQLVAGPPTRFLHRTDAPSSLLAVR
jgi:hypothetical protein